MKWWSTNVLVLVLVLVLLVLSRLLLLFHGGRMRPGLAMAGRHLARRRDELDTSSVSIRNILQYCVLFLNSRLGFWSKNEYKIDLFFDTNAGAKMSPTAAIVIVYRICLTDYQESAIQD